MIDPDIGASVAQRVKRWPADLSVPGLSPASGLDFFNRKRDSVAHGLSLSLTHRPDMTKILLKS